MSYSIAVESFETIGAFRAKPGGDFLWSHVFTLPEWMDSWRRAFSPANDHRFVLMKEDSAAIGAAPLTITGSTATFIGDPEVCDYLDFSIRPGHERPFFKALLEHLGQNGVAELDLRCLRPDSSVFPHLLESVESMGGKYSIEPDGVSLEMDLPDNWDDYLNMLSGKQRHEVRRKLRRLDEAGNVRFSVLDTVGAIMPGLDDFMRMFRDSRVDKAEFMTPAMESFFRSMILTMAEKGLMKIFVLYVDDSPLAANICFDYKDAVYLYNSGYDLRGGRISAGLMCKILSIKDSIEAGRKKYDFLKGAEPYKYRLGGKEVQLSRCKITFP